MGGKIGLHVVVELALCDGALLGERPIALQVAFSRNPCRAGSSHHSTFGIVLLRRNSRIVQVAAGQVDAT
jgi:hypothetical protein